MHHLPVPVGQVQLARSRPAAAGSCCTAALNSSRCASPRAGGNHRSAGISGLWALPHQRPPPIVQWCEGPFPAPPPWPMPASLGPATRMAYHRSRSLGVGAKIIRRRKSLTSICHCSKDRSISLTLIIYPPTTALSGPVPPQIYPIFLRISPRLWFSMISCRRPGQQRRWSGASG